MHVRKLAIGGLSAAAAVVIAAATAWACVSGPSITLTPANAKPGQTVDVTMRDFRKADPIQVRWNDLNAPVMATFAADGSGNPIKGTITVPDNAKPANYVVIFSQTAPDGKLSQAPVRALITVTPPNGATPVVGAPVAATDTARPAGLVTDSNSVSAGTLVLVAVGVAGLGLL
ncbi:MAG: hypothetical protein ACRD12_07310, partial [Acidimicrobiales bacterium]